MKLALGLGITGGTNPLAGLLAKAPGADRISSLTDNLHYSLGSSKALTDMFSDARASDHTVTNVNGSLVTVGSGEVSRGTRGLEVYGAATQLLAAPLDFSNAAWIKSATGTAVAPVVTTNAALAPDGTMTADRIDFDRGVGNLIGDTSSVYQGSITTTAQSYMGNVYLKAVNSADVGKELAVRHVGSASYGVITLTDVWQRVERIETSAGGTKSFDLASRGTITDDNQVSAYVWSANLVAGDYAGPPILTQSTRAASLVQAVQGYGPELATLANFDKRAATDGTVTFLPDGTLNFVNATAGLSTAVAEEITGLVIGATYSFTTSVRLISGSDLFTVLRTGSGGGGSSLAQTSTTTSSTFVTQTVEWVATQTSIWASVLAAVSSEFQVESATFKQVLPFPAYSGTEHTFKLTVNANGVTGDRVVRTLRKDATDQYRLHFASGVLRWEAFVGGVSQGAATASGIDDGGTHTIVCYINETTKELAMRVDGAAQSTVTATSVPTGIILDQQGHNGGANHVDGVIELSAYADGDYLDAWAT